MNGYSRKVENGMKKVSTDFLTKVHDEFIIECMSA